MRFRVVFDANVYISIVLSHQKNRSSKGIFSQLFDAASHQRFSLITSPYLIHEVAGILRTKFLHDEEEIQGFIKRIVRYAEIVTPDADAVQAIARDPDDDHVLACAVVGEADIIVTGDRDLLDLKTYRDIAIMRPRDFLRTIGGC